MAAADVQASTCVPSTTCAFKSRKESSQCSELVNLAGGVSHCPKHQVKHCTYVKKAGAACAKETRNAPTASGTIRCGRHICYVPEEAKRLCACGQRIYKNNASDKCSTCLAPVYAKKHYYKDIEKSRAFYRERSKLAYAKRRTLNGGADPKNPEDNRERGLQTSHEGESHEASVCEPAERDLVSRFNGLVVDDLVEPGKGRQELCAGSSRRIQPPGLGAAAARQDNVDRVPVDEKIVG